MWLKDCRKKKSSEKLKFVKKIDKNIRQKLVKKTLFNTFCVLDKIFFLKLARKTPFAGPQYASSELISTYEKGERRKKAIPRLFENSCLRLL